MRSDVRGTAVGTEKFTTGPGSVGDFDAATGTHRIATAFLAAKPSLERYFHCVKLSRYTRNLRRQVTAIHWE